MTSLDPAFLVIAVVLTGILGALVLDWIAGRRHRRCMERAASYLLEQEAIAWEEQRRAFALMNQALIKDVFAQALKSGGSLNAIN